MAPSAAPLSLASSLALSILVGLAPRAQESGQASRAGAAPSATRVEFHDSPAIDLYLQVRAASAPGKASPLAALEPAIELARALDRAMGGSPLAWAPLDGNLPGCKTAADLRAAFARAPETLQLRGGAKVELQKQALALADALVAAEAAFEPLWKRHQMEIALVRANWARLVGPKEPELFAYHLASLGMHDAGLVLPVYLVGDAPWPGAVTFRDENGHGVSFVGAHAAQGTGLLEVILHEVTHSLDLAAGEESAFGALRTKLTAAGLEARDRRLFDLPHGLMFVQSATSIRHVIDPAHRDYGEVEDVYQRLGAPAELIRGFWRDHLDGKLTADEALDGIVNGLGAR